jgi:hypothetical protein
MIEPRLRVYNENLAAANFVRLLPDSTANQLARSGEPFLERLPEVPGLFDRDSEHAEILDSLTVSTTNGFGAKSFSADKARWLLYELLQAMRVAKRSEAEAAASIFARALVDDGTPPAKAARMLLDVAAFTKLAGFLVPWELKLAPAHFVPIDDTGTMGGFSLDDILAKRHSERGPNKLQNFAVKILATVHCLTAQEISGLSVGDLRANGIMVLSKHWPERQLHPLSQQAKKALDQLASLREKQPGAPLFVKTGLWRSGEDEEGYDDRAPAEALANVARR